MCRESSEPAFRETENRIDVALAIPSRERRFLVALRDEGTHLGGSWEFPGGKIEAGEEPATAARRELLEETGLRAPTLELLVVVVHDYSELPLRFHVFLAPDPEGEVRMDRPRAWSWKSLSDLESLRMPEANRSMLRALSWRLGGRSG